MAITMENGYMRAVAKPSEQLVSKLRKLGWKKGQKIYFDREKLEMRFFDSTEELDRFISSKNPGSFSAEDPSWDSMADIELKLDQYEDLTG